MACVLRRKPMRHRVACIRAPDHIFVYGSLLSTVRGSLGERERHCLRWNAHLVGRGIIPGRMHDLGHYPVALIGTRPPLSAQAGYCPGNQIHGEVWRIRSARPLLSVLDTYEGIDRPRPEYARIGVEVTLTGAPGAGRKMTAWAYNYLGDVGHLPRIADGRWKIV